MVPSVGPGDGLQISRGSLEEGPKADSPKQLAHQPEKKNIKGNSYIKKTRI
jgi:hypothetical protein